MKKNHTEQKIEFRVTQTTLTEKRKKEKEETKYSARIESNEYNTKFSVIC